jgi:hypothetical protein
LIAVRLTGGSRFIPLTGLRALQPRGHFVVLRSEAPQVPAKAGQRLDIGQRAKILSHVAIMFRPEPRRPSHVHLPSSTACDRQLPSCSWVVTIFRGQLSLPEKLASSEIVIPGQFDYTQHAHWK